jgi:hypothetical protein
LVKRDDIATRVESTGEAVKMKPYVIISCKKCPFNSNSWTNNHISTLRLGVMLHGKGSG